MTTVTVYASSGSKVFLNAGGHGTFSQRTVVIVNRFCDNSLGVHERTLRRATLALQNTAVMRHRRIEFFIVRVYLLASNECLREPEPGGVYCRVVTLFRHCYTLACVKNVKAASKGGTYRSSSCPSMRFERRTISGVAFLMARARFVLLSPLLACAVRAPAPEPARLPTAPQPIVAQLNAASEDVVVRTNAQRRSLGLVELKRNALLMQAAQLQANQMAEKQRMAHEFPGGKYPDIDDRLAAVAYRWRASAENVAEGYSEPATVVAGWMKSPGHRENIVSSHFTEIGAGFATGANGRRYWAQVFAAPR